MLELLRLKALFVIIKLPRIYRVMGIQPRLINVIVKVVSHCYEQNEKYVL